MKFPLTNLVLSLGKSSKTIIPLVIVFNLAITLLLAYKLNIWVDEGFTLRTTENGLAYAIDQTLYSELQPPLYYILLNLWRNLSTSIFFSRLFSVLCISLSVYFAGKLSNCFLEHINPACVAAIVAFNPFSIWAATEIRPYALVILLSVLLLYFFFKAYLLVTSSASSTYIYLFIAIIALYTHYYLGFLIAANASCLFFLKRWKSLRKYLLGMIPVALCFAPMLLILQHQVNSHPALVTTSHSVFKSFTIVCLRVLIYIFPINQKLLLSSSYYEFDFLYYLPFCIFLSYFIIKRFHSIVNSSAVPILIILSIISICFLVIHQISHPVLYLLRHTTVLFIPGLFAAFSVFTRIFNRRQLYIIICVTFLIFANTLFTTYHSFTKIGDYKLVSSYIMQHEEHNQPILAFRSEIAIPLSYYYSGLNIIVPIPVSHIPTDYKKQVLNNEKEITEALSRILGEDKNFWIVMDTYTHRDRYLNISFNRHILEQFIEKHCIVLKSARFLGSFVMFVRFNEEKYKQLTQKKSCSGENEPPCSPGDEISASLRQAARYQY